MILSISNIAWDVNLDEEVSKILNIQSINYIDIAPSKYFKNIFNVSDAEIDIVKSQWNDRGITIYGMQALLFGLQKPLNIFGFEHEREELLRYLDAVCRIAGGLGVKHLTFGSPKNRDITDVIPSSIDKTAINFFNSLGNIAQKYNVIINLEPNPVEYNCNFCTTSEETYRIVTLVNHPNIKMQIDTGAIIMNREDVNKIYFNSGHIHLSEPNLQVLGTGNYDEYHEKIGTKLKNLPKSHYRRK
jgi:sugar phosphate isomerase/epimerase